MRVVDLSRPEAVPKVVIEESEAAELLMSLVALVGEEEYGSYDLGATRLTEVRNAIPSDLLKDMDRLVAGYEKVGAHLLGLVLETPPPRDVRSFLEQIERTEPREILRILLGYHYRAGHFSVDRKDIDLAVDGDPAARDRVLQQTEEWESWQVAIKSLLDMGADELKRLLLDTLPRWYESVFKPLAEEAFAAIRRDIETKKSLASTLDPERLVEVATNGIQQVREPGLKRYVLWPSYWLKPWVFTIDHRDARIFCHGVADESVEIDPTTPPPGLIKLYKALGDEGRLRLLRKLAAGPMSLSEAAEELGVAKSTAHHHLSLLRQAGLVLIREGDEKQYSLRRDLLPRSAELLEGYLGAPPPV